MNITEKTDYIQNIEELAIVNVASAISPATPEHVLGVTEDIVDKDFTINEQNGLRQNVINKYLNDRIDEVITGSDVELKDYAKKTDLQKYVATSALTDTLNSYVTEDELANKKYISGNIRDVALGEDKGEFNINTINQLLTNGEYVFHDVVTGDTTLPNVSNYEEVRMKIIVLSNKTEGTTGTFKAIQIMYLHNVLQNNISLYSRKFNGKSSDFNTNWSEWSQITINEIDSFENIKMKGIYQGQIEDEDCVIINVNNTQYKFSQLAIEYRIKDIEGTSSNGAYSEWEEYGGSSLNAIVDGETLILG